MIFIIRIIMTISQLLCILICVNAIMSWFVRDMPLSIRKFYDITAMIVEPILKPFKMLMHNLTYKIGLDISPILAIFAIELVAQLLITILQLI